MSFFFQEGVLHFRIGEQDHIIDTNGSATIMHGDDWYYYQYNNGLPVLSVVMKDNITHTCIFSDGLIRHYIVGDETYNFYNNVLLGSSKEGVTVPITMRNRIRCYLVHSNGDVYYDIVDDKFIWLLSLYDTYRQSAIINAPFTYDGYVDFYSKFEANKPVTNHFKDRDVSWTKVNDIIDGTITFNNYSAIVTRGYLEEEQVFNYTYVYNEGKVLAEVLIDQMPQKLRDGCLYEFPYNNGFLPGVNIYTSRINTPINDPDDTVRSHVRSVLPLNLFL